MTPKITFSDEAGELRAIVTFERYTMKVNTKLRRVRWWVGKKEVDNIGNDEVTATMVAHFLCAVAAAKGIGGDELIKHLEEMQDDCTD